MKKRRKKSGSRKSTGGVLGSLDFFSSSAKRKKAGKNLQKNLTRMKGNMKSSWG